jgi:acetyltransferase-like isoleucine patch superfamily enzyme
MKVLIKTWVSFALARLRGVYAQNAWRSAHSIRSVVGNEALIALIEEADGDDAVNLLRMLGAQVGARTRVLRGMTLHNADVMPGGLRIGDACHLGRQIMLDLAAPLSIGNRVTLSMRVSVLTHTHTGDAQCAGRRRIEIRAPVTISDDVYVGAGATILPGITIGRGAVVAAGAVVVRDVPEGSIVGGVPARPLNTQHSAS